MSLKVNEPSSAVVAMSKGWHVTTALMGGVAAMRAAGTSLLPKWPAEQEADYSNRLSRSTLSPAFRRTVSVMAAKPFSKPLTLGEDVPELLNQYLEDCDLQGNNFHTFASQVALEALPYGICGVLVDYPPTAGVRTLADERSIGARPYFVLIKHSQVLGWKQQTVGGVTKLLQLRILETVEEDDGGYGTESVEQVRVLEPGLWQTWRNGKGGWGLWAQGVTSLTEIPYVPFYGEQTGFLTGKSPLEDLGYLNVKHWQSQSDQDNILHVARVPILYFAGFQKEDLGVLSVGSTVGFHNPNHEAKVSYIEHSGAAIEAGRQSLLDLEQQMIQTGAELLVIKPGVRSATEANNEAEANKCDLQRITESWEDGLDRLLQFMADWAGLPEGGHVQLFKDFGAATLTEASAQLVLGMQQGGLITKQTAIRELQRRGELMPDIDPEEELEAVEAEGPALGEMDEPPPPKRRGFRAIREGSSLRVFEEDQ